LNFIAEKIGRRGPGNNELSVVFAANICKYTFSTDELVAAVYPGANRIEKSTGSLFSARREPHDAHAAVEAMAVRTHRIRGSDRGSVFVNVSDLHSYAIGRLRIDFFRMPAHR
jgi:hypothetical protein